MLTNDQLIQIIDAATDGVCVVDDQLRVVYVNHSGAALLGKVPADMQGKNLPDIVQELDSDSEPYKTADAPLFKALWERRPYRSVGERLCGVGTADFPAEYMVTPFTDGGMAIHFEDISLRMMAANYMRNVANHDPLTGLGNRALFESLLKQTVGRAERGQNQLALLYVDLDKFKPVNDQHGHEAGDELLKQVADRLKACVRDADCVARLGGDEFGVILEGTDAKMAAQRVAKAMVGTIAMPFKLAKAEVKIGCSIGAAIFPENGKDDENLLKAADEAMYAAKKSGGQRFIIAQQKD